MKSFIQFLVSLFFVSFLLGQETVFDPMHKITGNGVDTVWVRYFESGLIDANDKAGCIAVDNTGNVLVTGCSDGNYLTIKYNSNGDTVWVRRYNGPGNGENIPTAFAVDAIGNVYVTGTGGTIGYDQDGAVRWVALQSSKALALDGDGNVTVTGLSGTISYTNNGVQRWSTNQAGSALTVDAVGNVYVLYSLTTTKYNSGGDTLWTIHHGGTEELLQGVSSIAADKNGNLFVTGTYSLHHITGPARGETEANIITIKYDAMGKRVWMRSYGDSGDYDSPNIVVIDKNGNVYVTGMVGAFAGGGPGYSGIWGNHFGTIKYNTNGDSLWTGRHEGPNYYIQEEIYGSKVGSFSVVDTNGNVYVLGANVHHGESQLCVYKYSSEGIELWSHQSSFSVSDPNEGSFVKPIAIDGNGNVYVTIDGPDYVTTKLSPGGDSLWVRIYDSPNKSDDVVSAIAIEGARNVYVTGRSAGSGTSYDYATIKYNSNGDMLWVRRYNGPRNDYDGASSLAVDGSGNVYVTGTSSGSGTSSDYATIKYNSNGDTLWVRRYNGPGNSSDYASFLAVDGSGNVFVTGMSYSSGTSYDYATIKYNSNGDMLWVRRYNGPGNDYDGASSLAVDGSGNVYVTGTSSGSGTFSDYATIKYNSNGDTLWVRRYNSPGNSYDYTSSLTIDGSGNVYVTGTSFNLDNSYDYATIKYNSNGDTLWVRRYNGPGNSDDYARSFAVDGSGNVYVTGYNGSGTYSEYATIKYNSNGDTIWVRRYNRPGNDYDGASSLAVDGSGNVYVTGVSGNEIVSIKYSNAGNEEWVTIYSNGAGSNNVPVGIKVEPSGNVFVAGTSSFGNTSVYTVIKYKQTPTAVREISNTIPSSFALEQNYPNPFNPSTTIRYALPSSALVKLTVHDILGREIATLVNEEQSAGWKEVQWNALQISSGIYFYKLTAGNFVETKKCIVVK